MTSLGCLLLVLAGGMSTLLKNGSVSVVNIPRQPETSSARPASSEARVASLAQLKPSVARAGILSCSCGKVCKTKGGYAVHLYRAHGIRSPAAAYAPSDGLCMCCGMVFASRTLLQNHFTRGSQLCLLNVLLTVEPFASEEETRHKVQAGICAKHARTLGKCSGAAVLPAYRIPWASRLIIDLHGHRVDPTDSRHPSFVGLGRLNYGWHP